MISANNLSIQFGAKPLFENVSATFGNGNRYGMGCAVILLDTALATGMLRLPLARRL